MRIAISASTGLIGRALTESLVADGAEVAPGRWTPARKQELRASRIDSTGAIVRAMLAATPTPPVLIAASAIGW